MALIVSKVRVVLMVAGEAAAQTLTSPQLTLFVIKKNLHVLRFSKRVSTKFDECVYMFCQKS